MALEVVGRLGSVDLVADTNTLVYECPSGRFCLLAVGVANRIGSQVKIRLGITDSPNTNPATYEWFEYNTKINGFNALERNEITIGSEQRVIAYSDTAGVSVVIWGEVYT
jgi:hypothetical protein